MKLFTCAILCTLLAAPAALANGSSIRGGGKGVVCRDAKGTIQSVELLDLWEARTIYQRTIPESIAPVAEQVKAAAMRLKYANEDLLGLVSWKSIGRERPADSNDEFPLGVLYRAEILQNPEFTDLKPLRGVTLTLTDDSFEDARPAECAVEQVIVYKDTPNKPEVLLNQDLFDRMSPTNQAALILHEALYRYFRTGQGDENSIRTRRTVGYVFSGGTFTALSQILPREHGHCHLDMKKYGTTLPERHFRGFPIFHFFAKPGDPRTVQMIYNSDLRGHLAIGNYVKDWFTLSEDARGDEWKELANGRICEGVPNKKGTMSNHHFRISGSGPVDYDKGYYSFDVYCKNEKPSFTLRADPGFEKEGSSPTLYLQCELGQAN